MPEVFFPGDSSRTLRAGDRVHLTAQSTHITGQELGWAARLSATSRRPLPAKRRFNLRPRPQVRLLFGNHRRESLFHVKQRNSCFT